MNAIDAALANGLANRLRLAMDAGSTIHARGNIARDHEGRNADAVATEVVGLANGAPPKSTLSLWLTRSSDGERLIGEIVVSTERRAGDIVWNLGDGSVRIECASTHTVTFDSSSDRLSASGDPIGILRMTRSEACNDIADLVEELGYTPIWTSFGGTTIPFKVVPLGKACD